MRSNLRVCRCLPVFLPALFCTVSPARGTSDQPASVAAEPAERNAALLYWQFRQEALESQLFTVFGTDEQDAKDWTPNAEETKSLVENKAVIQKLLRATKLNLCDWGTEYELGLGVTLHQLPIGRGAARLLRADARRLIAASDGDAAAERIAAMFLVARHMNEPHATTVSTMTGGGIVSMALTEIDNLVAHDALTARGRESIRPCVYRLLETDPLDIVAALRFERDWAREALYQEILPGVLERQGLKRPAPGEALQNRVRAETGTRLVTADFARRLRPAFDEAIACWGDPDAVPKLNAIWERAEAGEFGQGSIMLAKLHERKQSELEIIERAKRIRAKLDAEPGSR